jgi:hypothetical protein
MIKKKREYKRQNDVEWLISELKSIGIKVLRNENTSVYLDGKDFLRKAEIVGLEDTIIRKTDISKAFKGLEEKNDLEKNKKSEPAGDDFLKKRNIGQYDKVFAEDERNIHFLHKSGIIRICLTHTPDYDLLVDLSKKKYGSCYVRAHTWWTGKASWYRCISFGMQYQNQAYVRFVLF